MFIRMGAKQGFMILFCFAFIFSLNWFIGVITVPLTILSFAIIMLIIKKTRPEFIMTQTAIDYVNREVEEDTDGVREVKAFCREGHMDEKFAEANENLTYVTYSSVSKMGLSSAHQRHDRPHPAPRGLLDDQHGQRERALAALQ